MMFDDDKSRAGWRRFAVSVLVYNVAIITAFAIGFAARLLGL